jgi:hypothetical protein
MLSACFPALFAVLTAPVAAPVPAGAGGATDLSPIYPDGTCVALGIDIRGVLNSPLGKKVVGDDKPFDAARKLLKVLLPLEGALPVEGDVGKAIAAVANRLNRVTLALEPNDGRFVIYLEGEITEDAYVRAAEQLAKSSNRAFTTEKLGERKLVIVGEGAGTVYGLRLSEALFLITARKELLEEVLDKHAGKKTAAIDKLLAQRLKTVKTAETPVWLAIGDLKIAGGTDFVNDLSGLVGTISLKADADIRIVGNYDTEDQARKTKGTLEGLLGLLPLIGGDDRAKVWNAADIKVKHDGKTVTATGSIPAKLLTDEYAKQK